MGLNEDVLGCYLVRRLALAAKEVVEHARVAVDRAVGAGAAFLLHHEGDHRAFPVFADLRGGRRWRCCAWGCPSIG